MNHVRSTSNIRCIFCFHAVYLYICVLDALQSRQTKVDSGKGDYRDTVDDWGERRKKNRDKERHAKLVQNKSESYYDVHDWSCVHTSTHTHRHDQICDYFNAIISSKLPWQNFIQPKGVKYSTDKLQTQRRPAGGKERERKVRGGKQDKNNAYSVSKPKSTFNMHNKPR